MKIKKQTRNAIIYGISIVFIFYAVLGVAVSCYFCADAILNNTWPLMSISLPFSLLIIFAALFLGAFEIRMPGLWINKGRWCLKSWRLGWVFSCGFYASTCFFSLYWSYCGDFIVKQLLEDPHA